MKISESLKREINKQYKYLQIDIDYVFQRMLLLKKKKYAALKVVNYSNGKITSQREVKGIDLVRRDWSLITKMAGNRLLELLFSDSNEEENDFRVKIGEYLDDLAKRMRNNEIPLEQYTITKSLTHALKDYNMKNVSNNPHVVVALRMQKAGQILNISFYSSLHFILSFILTLVISFDILFVFLLIPNILFLLILLLIVLLVLLKFVLHMVF